MNLLDETKNVLVDNGKSLEDIAWVGCDDFRIPIDAFLKAADTEYLNGFGAQEVAMDLIVVLRDGSWLERKEYDGSEWWEFKSEHVMPEKEWNGSVALTVNQVDGPVGWKTLEDLCILADRGQRCI